MPKKKNTSIKQRIKSLFSYTKRIKEVPQLLKKWLEALRKFFTVKMPAFLRRCFLWSLDTVSEDVAGVRLIKNSTALVLYLCVFAGLLSLVVRNSNAPLVQALIHPENGTEILIGVGSMLLALLLPVAILIIQDSKDALLRRTVVKNIIQLNKLPLVVGAVSLTLFIPQGQPVLTPGITLRTIGGAVAGTCFVYIVMMLLKSYRWLSDGSEATEGLTSPPEPGDLSFNYPNQFISYRFAQIVRFLSQTASHEAWTQLWGKWWPSTYDSILHKAFFKRHKDILSKNKAKKYGLAGNELTAYRNNIDQRILEDYSYTIEHLSEFLEIYRLMHDGSHLSPKDKRLYTANNAVATIIREIVEKNMTDEKVYFVATAIENYVIKRYGGLDHKEKSVRDPVLTSFVSMLFDAIYKGKVSNYELRSSLNSYSKRWGVSYGTIYEDPQTISMTLVNTFWGWLKTVLKGDIDTEDSNFGIGDVLKFVFPTSDTITLGHLYWYLFVSENTVDETEGLKNFMTATRPFVLMSNTAAEFVPAGSEKDSLERFRKEVEAQQQEAVKLFANLYASYLLKTRNLDNLISLCERLSQKTSKPKEAAYILHLSELFKALKAYYESKT